MTSRTITVEDAGVAVTACLAHGISIDCRSRRCCGLEVQAGWSTRRTSSIAELLAETHAGSRRHCAIGPLHPRVADTDYGSHSTWHGGLLFLPCLGVLTHGMRAAVYDEVYDAVYASTTTSSPGLTVFLYHRMSTYWTGRCNLSVGSDNDYWITTLQGLILATVSATRLSCRETVTYWGGRRHHLHLRGTRTTALPSLWVLTGLAPPTQGDRCCSSRRQHYAFMTGSMDTVYASITAGHTTQSTTQSTPQSTPQPSTQPMPAFRQVSLRDRAKMLALQLRLVVVDGGHDHTRTRFQ
eukprot:COSAG01_NODE_18594_length_1065_cov_1.731884_1_plen_296_part_00